MSSTHLQKFPTSVSVEKIIEVPPTAILSKLILKSQSFTRDNNKDKCKELNIPCQSAGPSGDDTTRHVLDFLDWV